MTISGRSLNRYTTSISRRIIDIIKAPTVKEKISEMSVSEEVSLKNPNGIDEIIADLSNIRDFILILSVNDDSYVDVTGAYATNPESREQSDFYITLDLPRNYDNSIAFYLIPDLKETIRHELEHSVDSTESLVEPPEDKFSSIENLKLHFLRGAEKKGYVVGLLRNAITSNREVSDLIDSYLSNVYVTGLNYGLPAPELNTALSEIRSAWRSYLKKRYPRARLHEIIKEAKRKRKKKSYSGSRPEDSYMQGTPKNLYLDREIKALPNLSIRKNGKEVPVNVQIRDYLKSMKLIPEEDIVERIFNKILSESDLL